MISRANSLQPIARRIQIMRPHFVPFSRSLSPNRSVQRLTSAWSALVGTRSAFRGTTPAQISVQVASWPYLAFTTLPGTRGMPMIGWGLSVVMTFSSRFRQLTSHQGLCPIFVWMSNVWCHRATTVFRLAGSNSKSLLSYKRSQSKPSSSSTPMLFNSYSSSGELRLQRQRSTDLQTSK